MYNSLTLQRALSDGVSKGQIEGTKSSDERCRAFVARLLPPALHAAGDRHSERPEAPSGRGLNLLERVRGGVSDVRAGGYTWPRAPG